MLGIEIHVRSVFLHGLYFKNPNDLGSYFDEITLENQYIDVIIG